MVFYLTSFYLFSWYEERRFKILFQEVVVLGVLVFYSVLFSAWPSGINFYAFVCVPLDYLAMFTLLPLLTAIKFC